MTEEKKADVREKKVATHGEKQMRFERRITLTSGDVVISRNKVTGNDWKHDFWAGVAVPYRGTVHLRHVARRVTATQLWEKVEARKSVDPSHRALRVVIHGMELLSDIMKPGLRTMLEDAYLEMLEEEERWVASEPQHKAAARSLARRLEKLDPEDLARIEAILAK